MCAQPRWLLLVCGFFQSFLCSGILYGWPGLVLILKTDGLYADSCADTTDAGSAAGAAALDAGVTAAVCEEQQTALNTLFTISQGVLTGAMMANGAMVDRFGPRLVSCYGTALVLAGLLLFGLVGPAAAGRAALPVCCRGA